MEVAWGMALLAMSAAIALAPVRSAVPNGNGAPANNPGGSGNNDRE